MAERTSVLLGAGASVDAGLPLTTQLAEQLIARANASAGGFRRSWVRALNFVYGAMVGYQAEDGDDPLQAVNIERLISALRLLQSAKTHEVAPFVSAWKAGALGLTKEPAVGGQLGRQAVEAVKQSLVDRSYSAERDWIELFKAVSQAATNSSDTRAFTIAEEHILEGLSEILGSLGDVDYLAPLGNLAMTQPGGLDVITLNYDLAIEKLVVAHGLGMDRGIDRWAPGVPLRFRSLPAHINLYKLHGSLDWMLDPPRRGTDAPQILVAPAEPEVADRSRSTRPWIVVGDREKLATDGPTLALLRAAEDALRRSTRLVVVGYSFSDNHVNAMIRDWMLAKSSRTIVILDKHWSIPHAPSFRTALIGAYGHDPSAKRRARLAVVQGSAASALSDAITRSHADVVDVTAHIERHDDHWRVALLLGGGSLHRGSIEFHEAIVPEGPYGATSVRLDAAEQDDGAQWLARPPSPGRRPPIRFDSWEEGSELVAYVRRPSGSDSGVTAMVTGSRLNSLGRDTFRVEM